jgi:hypothetical protein
VVCNYAEIPRALVLLNSAVETIDRLLGDGHKCCPGGGTSHPLVQSGHAAQKAILALADASDILGDHSVGCANGACRSATPS